MVKTAIDLWPPEHWREDPRHIDGRCRWCLSRLIVNQRGAVLCPKCDFPERKNP